MKKILFLLLTLGFCLPALAQAPLEGMVRSAEDGQPLKGASVTIKGTATGTTTDEKGHFLLEHVPAGASLLVTSVRYEPQEITLAGLGKAQFTVTLEPRSMALEGVVVSTGYQQLPQERATGSFDQIGNALLNRSVSTDILSRLADVTSGLIFNHQGTSAISIRGQSTIFGDASPLIVVDNFPYDGDIANINPNDVESVTVLKDAAAASIWGSRAGNGVIVITTKKGKFNQAMQVAFNANVTLGAKPNQFYIPQMSPADYISVEKMLFAQGYYDSAQSDPSHLPLTPVVQLLYAEQQGTISAADAGAQISAFAKQDVRNDINRYLFRVSAAQQYALSLNGGSGSDRYFVSGGYDKDLANARGNGYDRVTLNVSDTYSLAGGRLELSTQLYYTDSQTPQNAVPLSSLNMSSLQPLYPYARLADAAGRPLALVHDYNTDFVGAAPQQGFLNWQYKPLEELALSDNHTAQTDYRLNLGLKYRIIPGLSASLLYQYGKTYSELRNYQSQDSYYTRNLINEYTIVNPDGSLTYPIPLGGILDLSETTSVYQDARAQLDLNKTIGSRHEIVALAGAEIRDNHSYGFSTRFYGYDDEHASSKPVDYTDTYAYSYNTSLTGNLIPNEDGFSDLTDRFLSYYGNGAYTYNRRYTFSASARLDQSNLFGVNTNQKGVPLYSLGGSWKISDEGFYHSDLLPYLKLRATYGYNGNIDKSLSAYTTANYFDGSQSIIGQNFARIINPPNPDLRWERDRIINLGLDFQLCKNVIGGSLEYYRKQGLDLIGNSPYAPQTGILTFTGNTADTRGQGVDLTLNSKNLDGRLKWTSNFLFSYVQDKVTRYLATSTDAVDDYLLGGYPIPTAGRPLYGIYSFKWAGLDPATGDPRGYLNGQVSEDYAGIKAAATAGNLVYNGPGRPVVFGSLRNTFSYGSVSFSANISYRLGYYVRRSSVNYETVLTGTGGYGDFDQRWQKPGDEKFTQVPSMPASINPDREDFYTYSSVLVERGDNIRLQDINVSYTLDKKQFRGLPFARLQCYIYANNLALLWKAARYPLDPDYLTQYALPPVRTVSFGLKGNF